MAEVLSPLSQSSSTISMLHTRPTSSDTFQSSGAGSPYHHPQQPQQQQQQHYHHHHPHHQQHQQQRLNNTTGNTYSSPSSGYRATSVAPVQPYAFQATPALRQETRTISASSINPQIHSTSSSSASSAPRHGHGSTPSTSTTSSDMSSATSAKAQRSPSKDDMFAGSARNSFINISSSVPDLSLTALDNTPKSSPNRYRRTPQRQDSSNSVHRNSVHGSAAPSGSGMAAVGHLYNPPTPPPIGQMVRTASDDLTVTKTNTNSSEAAKRYRRRSLNSLESGAVAVAAAKPSSAGGQSPPSDQRPVSHHGGQGSSTIRPVSFHSRTNSTESVNGRRGTSATPPIDQTTKPSNRSPAQANGAVKVPARGSSANPSPLSRSPMTGPTSPEEQRPHTYRPNRAPTMPAASPAAKHLAALNSNDLNMGMKSRLRRAFSFGSAAELRRATENVPPQALAGTPAPPGVDEMDLESLRIARQQEAAGIGAGIYNGQGGFTGSTDNLSISSTASSASMMIRKMGKGMKKGGRSLKGLFRPKSVIGVPAADGPVQPGLAQVSMVTVEAERHKVNVNAHPAEHPSGGTGFPKLEKNSMDAARGGVFDSNDRNDSMRKSIIGNDSERAEVLATVKKGILKRHAPTSPNASPDMRPPQPTENSASHSPTSSMPPTPRDDRASRSMSSTTSDYFSGRLGAPVARSVPGTPQGSRNISFSPRIQFYDAWSSGDYDRRGDIATCNRLTPMLAQQIKEEINMLKMEMEVHELSKPHTHFF